MKSTSRVLELAAAWGVSPQTIRELFRKEERNAEDCAATWRKAYSRLFKIAGVDGHCHQFRHTYATRLLQAGVSLDTVSIMLAHSSVKITQKHYAAWTKERREKIEAAIRKTWAVSGQSSGTPEAREVLDHRKTA
jgi:integrase